MPKVQRIHKVNTREQVSCLPNVGAQKRQLIEIFESIKPTVLTQAVQCDGTNFADLGVYFSVLKDRKYCLKVECTFSDTDLDGVVQLAISPVANLAEFKFLGFAIDGNMAITQPSEVVSETPGTQGIAWTPSTEWNVVTGYATVYFQVIDSATIALSFLAGQGDTTMLPASNFTLTEIEPNDE